MADPYLHFTIRGVFGGAVATATEQWATTFAAVKRDGSAMGGLPEQTRMNSIHLRIATFVTGASSKISDQAWFVNVRCALIGPDGRVARDPDSGAYIQRDSQGDAVRGSGIVYHPNQAALVVSLLTAGAGKRGKGRQYWPAPAVGLEGTGRVSPATRDAFLGGLEAMYESINNDLDVDPINAQVAVFSAADGVGRKVLQLRVGRVIDTQRRRRSDLDEDYALASIAQ